jgi:hypothetical protein
MMEASQSIDLTELRRLSDALFARLERDGVRSVNVASPHYWTVFADDAFGMDKTPDLVIGDVLDDLRDLRRDLHAAGDEAFTPWHAFHHLSGLMLMIAAADMQGSLTKAAEEE